MKYDIKHLQAFIVFVESKNIVEAAEKLQVSQPALSAYLKSFEGRLTQPIFVMQGRKKALTTFGQEIYQHLKDRMSGLDEVIDQIALKYNDKNAVNVRIGGRGEVLSRVLRQLQFPGQLIAMECDSKTGIQMVQKSQLDLLIVQEKPDSLDLIAKAFFKDSFRLLIPKKMKIKDGRDLPKTLALLQEQPYLAYKIDFDAFKKLQSHYGMKQTPQTLRIYPDWNVLRDLCQEGLGWTLLPSSFPFDDGKCHSLEIPESVLSGTQFYLIYHRNLSKTKWFLELLNEVRAVFNAS